jgi:Ca2+-binding EF-hand superfamily protein
MGSGLTKSSKLVKPDDCDKEVWSKILKLFDRLDKDGTHSIEENELMGHITNLHTKNNLRRIRKEKEIC